MPIEPHIEIRLLSQPRYLSVARAAVEAAAVKMGLPHEASRITLAVDEALTNVIRHGYGGREDRPIWVKLAPLTVGGRAGMEVLIEDESAPIDLKRIEGRPLDEIRPG